MQTLQVLGPDVYNLIFLLDRFIEYITPQIEESCGYTFHPKPHVEALAHRRATFRFPFQGVAEVKDNVILLPLSYLREQASLIGPDTLRMPEYVNPEIRGEYAPIPNDLADTVVHEIAHLIDIHKNGKADTVAKAHRESWRRTYRRLCVVLGMKPNFAVQLI